MDGLFLFDTASSNIMTHPIKDTNETHKVDSTDNIDGIDGVSGVNSDDNVFRKALSAIQEMLSTLKSFFVGLYNKISQNSKIARSSQNMSNRMDEVIAEAAKGDDKTREKIPDDVVDYMEKNGIKVDGENIKQYIKDHGDAEGKLDKGALQATKGGLDNDANCRTDVMSQMQVQVQSETQEISLFTTQESGLVDKWMSIENSINERISH